MQRPCAWALAHSSKSLHSTNPNPKLCHTSGASGDDVNVRKASVHEGTFHSAAAAAAALPSRRCRSHERPIRPALPFPSTQRLAHLNEIVLSTPICPPPSAWSKPLQRLPSCPPPCCPPLWPTWTPQRARRQPWPAGRCTAPWRRSGPLPPSRSATTLMPSSQRRRMRPGSCSACQACTRCASCRICTRMATGSTTAWRCSRQR